MSLTRALVWGAILMAQGCATLAVKDHVDFVGVGVLGHLAWWNDSIPRVIVLPRVCSGSDQQFQVSASPAVYLRLDLNKSRAFFHDSAASYRPIACGDSLRLVVSRHPIARGATDSVVLMGNMAREGQYPESYSLGKDDAHYEKNTCAAGKWCLREGAKILYLHQGRVHSLNVVERLHPERSAWARHERAMASVPYLAAVPVDILLSPLYLLGFGFLAWACSNNGCNPWH